MKWHWDRFFSEYSGFLCQYRSANAPYTPPSTDALSRTSGRRLGTYKSNGVSAIRTRLSRLHWANTSAAGTTSWYLTPTNPNVDVSWLAFLFQIWWLSRNLTVAKLSLGHSRWCLHRVTCLRLPLRCDVMQCSKRKMSATDLFASIFGAEGFHEMLVPVCQTTRRIQPRS
jgi:hypothetical protein